MALFDFLKTAGKTVEKAATRAATGAVATLKPDKVVKSAAGVVNPKTFHFLNQNVAQPIEANVKGFAQIPKQVLQSPAAYDAQFAGNKAAELFHNVTGNPVAAQQSAQAARNSASKAKSSLASSISQTLQNPGALASEGGIVRIGTLEQLGKATTEASVKSILKNQVPTAIANKIAPSIAATKDTGVINNILKGSSNIVKQPEVRIPPVADPKGLNKAQAGQDIVSATLPKPPQVISRSPTESPELVGQVQRGKLQRSGEVAPIDSLKLGSDTKGTYDTAQVAKYVNDIKQGRTVDPVVIDSKGFIQDGKHRLEAMRQLGVKDVPVVQQIEKPKLSGAAQQSTLSKKITDVSPQDLAKKPLLNPPTNEIPVTPVQKVINALGGDQGVKGVGALQREQKGLYSAERSARLAKAQGSVGDLTGREAVKAQLSSLKGELPKADAEKLVTHLKSKVSQDDVNSVLDTLRTSPKLKGYEPITAQNAIVNLFDKGKIPTPSEMKILEKAVGSDFTDSIGKAVTENVSTFQKAKNTAAQVLGAPKAVMASFDLSGGFRQGGVLGSRFPKEFASASKAQLKYFASKDAYESALKEIANRDTAPLMKRAKLAIAGEKGVHEEAYTSQLAEKIPGLGKGIAASDRAYTGLLTKLRADSFDHIMNDLKSSGVDPRSLSDKALRDIGRFINTASGRGSLGSLEKHATTLQEALFSPRLWKSRLDMLNPAYYAKLSPVARKYALQSAGSFAAIAGTVLTLATLAGAKVETDARSSDFLKIKFGNTRYDILGGFQQNLVFAWRELKNEKKNSQTGAVTKLGDKFGSPTRLGILGDLVQNKENPVFSAGSRILSGKDKAGNPVNPATEVAKLGIPLGIQEGYAGYKDSGAGGVAKTLPGVVGVGSQTYGTSLNSKQNDTIKKLKSSGASKEKIDAYTNFFQTATQAKGLKSNTSDKINTALKNKDIKKAQQLAKDYNTNYTKAFDKWRSKYKQYADATLSKEYRSNKINLTPASVKARLKTIASNQ